jgi:hypothetical protein
MNMAGMMGDDGTEAGGVERQRPLQAEQAEERQERHAAEGQQRQGVGAPALLPVGVHPAHPVDEPLDGQEDPVAGGAALVAVDPGHVPAERWRRDEQDSDEEEELEPAGTGHGSEALREQQGHHQVAGQDDRQREPHGVLGAHRGVSSRAGTSGDISRSQPRT